MLSNASARKLGIILLLMLNGTINMATGRAAMFSSCAMQRSVGMCRWRRCALADFIGFSFHSSRSSVLRISAPRTCVPSTCVPSTSVARSKKASRIGSIGGTMRRATTTTASFHSEHSTNSDGDEHDEAKFHALKVAELRDLLRQRGQQISGTKADLVKRLSASIHDSDDHSKNDSSNDSKSDSAASADHVKYEKGWDQFGNEGEWQKLASHSRRSRRTTSKDEVTEEKNQIPSNLIFQSGDDSDSDSEAEDWDDDDWEEDDEEEEIRNMIKLEQRYQKDAMEFRQNFQGTRVFVQGFSKDVTWQDLKEHFQIAGEVVYASVSYDRINKQSKQCGIVQFETTEMALNAIKIMRHHPLKGDKIYVREDVQEKRADRGHKDNLRRKPRPQSSLPTEWKRANDENEQQDGWYNPTSQELHEIESLISQRDAHRRNKDYHQSDKLRDELQQEHFVHLDDRLKLWWIGPRRGGRAPKLLTEIKGQGRWGKARPWRQIPTTPENDALVDSDDVTDLLQRRDGARSRKEFDVADALLAEAHAKPRGEKVKLLIHDDSRTWRVWTEEKPSFHRQTRTSDGIRSVNRRKGSGDANNSNPSEMCIKIVMENEPEKVDEIKTLLDKFPGREWNVYKKLKQRYNV